MVGWVKKQTSKSRPMQHFKHAQQELNDMSKMMLKTNCLCKPPKMFLWKQFVFLFWKMFKRKLILHVGKICMLALGGFGVEVNLNLATITSNKNGWLSNKNLEAMIKATNPESPSKLLGQLLQQKWNYPTLKDGEKNMLTN